MGQGSSRIESRNQQQVLEQEDRPQRLTYSFALRPRRRYVSRSRTRRYSNVVNAFLRRSPSETQTSSPVTGSNTLGDNNPAVLLTSLSSVTSGEDNEVARAPINEPLERTSHTAQLHVSEADQNLALLVPLSQQAYSSMDIDPVVTHQQSRNELASSTDRTDFEDLTGLPQSTHMSGAYHDTESALNILISNAANATAATLRRGNAESAINNFREIATEIDGEDGTFSSFLHTLGRGRLTDLTHDYATGSSGMYTIRTFRFGAASHTSMINDGSNSPILWHDDEQQTHQQMIPVLIVGIRASSTAEAPHDMEEGLPSLFDTLTDLPADIELLNNNNSTTRLAQRYGPSMPLGEAALSPNIQAIAQIAPRRVQPSFDGGQRPSATGFSERFAPVETDNTLLRSYSIDDTVTDWTSAGNTPISGRWSRPEYVERALDTFIADATVPAGRPERRRSLGDLEAASTRRNGVLIEPGETSMTEEHRSWTIYILGDSPTYEDMIRLSALLGQARSPVASAAAIAAASGVLKIEKIGSTIHAVDSQDETTVVLSGERCLVCLGDYKVQEEVRQLVKCTHVFHRTCIDQWLLTGRNSCPLCRTQGVEDENTPVVPEASH